MRAFRSVHFLALVAFSSISAQDELPPVEAAEPGEPIELQPFMGTGDVLNWITEGEGDLGGWATIGVPEGMGFLNGEDADKLLQMYGNPPDDYVGAMATEDLGWTVIFQFAEEGYVKDDEKDELDADEILESLREGQKAGNEARKEMGLDSLTLEGWAVEPNYNEATNNLEWATIVAGSDGSRTVNYETRLLGRHGYMNVTLLCDPEALEAVAPDYQSLIAGFAYNSGKTYAEFRSGDKLATYGLTALVAGGGMYAAAKTGLLGVIFAFAKKAWYLVVAAVVGIWTAVKRFFGGRASEA